MVTARTYPFINASSQAMVQLIEMRRQQLEEEDAPVPGGR
jgi:membrane protein required for colicin V production